MKTRKAKKVNNKFEIVPTKSPKIKSVHFYTNPIQKGKEWLYDEYVMNLFDTGDLETDIKNNLEVYLEQGKIEDDYEKAKHEKIVELSKHCAEKIQLGTEVQFEDGHKEHFSYGIVDQINLKEKVDMGKPAIYHANNEENKKYSFEDIKIIYDTLSDYKEKLLTKHNLLKHYINQLETVGEIMEVRFDEEVPAVLQNKIKQ